jgi:hypothetical protein
MLILAKPPVTGGAITYVNQGIAQMSYANTSNLYFTAPIGAGHTVIVGCKNTNNLTLSSLTDDKGNNYPTRGQVGQIMAFTGSGLIGGATVLTINWTAGGASFGAIWYTEYSGGVFDQWNGLQQNWPGGGADLITSGAITTTQPGELIWGMTTTGNNFATGGRAGTGFTQRLNQAPPSNEAFVITEDMIQAAAGPVAATFTDPSGSGWTYYTHVIALK